MQPSGPSPKISAAGLGVRRALLALSCQQGCPTVLPGASHSSHGRWPRPHKHRGLPGPGQSRVPIQVFFLRMRAPSRTLKLPLFHHQLCVFNYQAQRVCLGWGGPRSALCQPRAWQTLRVQQRSGHCGAHAPPTPIGRRVQSKPIGSPVPVSAARGITYTSPHGPAGTAALT